MLFHREENVFSAVQICITCWSHLSGGITRIWWFSERQTKISAKLTDILPLCVDEDIPRHWSATIRLECLAAPFRLSFSRHVEATSKVWMPCCSLRNAVWYCRQELSETFVVFSWNWNISHTQNWKMPNHTNAWVHQTTTIYGKKSWKKSGKCPTPNETWPTKDDMSRKFPAITYPPGYKSQSHPDFGDQDKKRCDLSDLNLYLLTKESTRKFWRCFLFVKPISGRLLWSSTYG